jgi:MFS family permease
MTLTGLLATFDGACLGRFLAGVGGAGGNVPAMALVAAWFGGRRRGVAAGAAVAGSSIGLMVTGPLIPALLSRHGAEGWRISWYALGAMAFVAALLCALLLRNRPEEHGWAPIGETAAEAARRHDGQKAAALRWSLVYRSRVLWHLAAVYFAFGFSYVIYSTFFIRHLVRDGGFTLATAGLLWLVVGVVSVISGFIWGSVSDHWGRRPALLCVFALQGVAFLLFGLSRELPAIYLSAGLFAITAWSIPALMAALCGDIFGGRLAPAALGWMTIVFGVGQALGPYLAGRMADATHSFSLAFVTAGLVALVLGGGGSLLLHPQIHPE